MKRPRWSEKLARPVRDVVDDVTLRTRDDARSYMTALPESRARCKQWQAAARLLLEGADVEAIPSQLELALM